LGGKIIKRAVKAFVEKRKPDFVGQKE